MNKVEQWKQAKHGLDVWPDLVRYAAEQRPMSAIDDADLERMKWYGAFYRKRDGAGAYMLRIRVTAGELTAEQAKAAAHVAYQFGYGIVDLTTRANLQVQGLDIASLPIALARLEATGLTARQTGHDNVRNVFGHALAGIDPEELIDTRPLCREITELFLDSRTYSDLPRKFNVALNGRPRHATHYWTQDISFLACAVDSETLFQVLVGGTQGQSPHLGTHLPVLVRPDQAVDVTRALLDLFREQGSRERRDQSRFCYLLERIGVGGVLDWLEQRLAFRLQPWPSPPSPPTGYDDTVGWFPQKQPQRWALGLNVPLGRLGWQQLEAVAVLAKKWGDGTLRTTPEQGLLVASIQTGFKDAAATDAAACGLDPYGDSLARATVACTGKQFCNIAVTETKGHMLQLMEKLRARGLALHGIRIHMSGCPSSCAQHHTADIGLKGVRVRRLLGTKEGFDVYLGGGVAGQIHLGLIYRLGVDVDQLPQLIEQVVREYYLKHKPGQTFSAYWREKLRGLEAAKAGDRDYVVPVWMCERCGYHHAGEDPPVYCPKCAGLRREFARLEQSAATSPAAPEIGVEPAAAKGTGGAVAPPRADGFCWAAKLDDLPEGQGLAVTVLGCEIALFRHDGQVVAIDNACPHAGGPLAQGVVEGGVVTCPWHGWRFQLCDGCSLDPPGRRQTAYQVSVEEGQVYLRAYPKTAGDCPNFAQSAKQNGTVPLSEAVLG